MPQDHLLRSTAVLSESSVSEVSLGPITQKGFEVFRLERLSELYIIIYYHILLYSTINYYILFRYFQHAHFIPIVGVGKRDEN